MASYDRYVQGWVERARVAAQSRKEREARARDLLPMLVEHLVRHHGARRVVLFGSLAEGGFGPGSDIDLAVEGIQGARLYQAGAELEDLCQPFRVDLVPIEDAYETVREKIERTGTVLHG